MSAYQPQVVDHLEGTGWVSDRPPQEVGEPGRVTWTPRQHSAALRHRAWHRVPPPRPKRPAPGWAPIGAIWARLLSEYDLIGWVQQSTDGSLWYAFVGYSSAGQHRTLDAAKAAVDAQLRLDGWDT